MPVDLKSWRRLEFEDVPVYIQPECPDWLVPDNIGDFVLEQALKGEEEGSVVSAYFKAFQKSPAAASLEVRRFLSLLERPSRDEYRGRAAYLGLRRLKECWFHMTNRCNLECSHCMFCSSPKRMLELDKNEILPAVEEGRALGCELFYFTGGEPLVHPQFFDICHSILRYEGCHVVVLTNGLLLSRHIEKIRLLPLDRFHIQVSIDGLEENHDRLRGKGAYRHLVNNLKELRTIGAHATMAMCVNASNVHDMANIVDVAWMSGVQNVHYLWFFVRGHGHNKDFVEPAVIFEHLKRAYEKGMSCGIFIDNIELLKSQIFSPPGTKFDLSNTAWESLVVGPDRKIYPSPALVGLEEVACGDLSQGLEMVWRTSRVLNAIRRASVVDSPIYMKNPLRYVIGGGDLDHSYIYGGRWTGSDPYVPLYNQMALYLIANASGAYRTNGYPQIRLKMGDQMLDCGDEGDTVSLTHCNCVISLSEDHGHTPVRAFYSKAAEDPNKDIFNPVSYPEHEIAHIPEASRVRSYGCGSPVFDAELKEGEVVVDLGSGSGIECFVAAKKIGPTGKVYGIDMTDEMLRMARTCLTSVRRNLGYENVQFAKGYLESLPLGNDEADVVLSNCVINLSPDKRHTFAEAFRILKPGGRLVISDVVSDDRAPSSIKRDEQLRGECIAGAMVQEELFAMLTDTGFVGARVLKRFFYREVQGFPFYSLTFSARKPARAIQSEVVYRGPFPGILMENGELLLRGKKMRIAYPGGEVLDESVFVLDDLGNVSNVTLTSTCDCYIPPESNKEQALESVPFVAHQSGCLACGAPIRYLEREQNRSCYYCGVTKLANAVCEEDHFICDTCHTQDGVEAVKAICTSTQETDMIRLLKTLRSHPAIPIHGPEHHFIVPGIILSTYANLGGAIGRDEIVAGIERGRSVPGGTCAFWGTCGAAIGVGIAFSIIMDANPLRPSERKRVQEATIEVFNRIASYEAARCCQRESWLALTSAAQLSRQVLPVALKAQESLECIQFRKNKECLTRDCPLWKDNKETV